MADTNPKIDHVNADGQKCFKPVKFQVDDDNWLAYFKENGYVVLENLASPDVVKSCKADLWEQLEALGSGIKRDDVTTWSDENWPGWLHTGFLLSHGLPQGKAAWTLRGLPSVKKAFSTIWGTEDLVSSMDIFIAWRPWNLPNVSKPRVERLHVDQSATMRKGFHCVQGMMVLQDVTPKRGGLQVVPKTNTDAVQAQIAKWHPTIHDWVEFRPNNPYITDKKGCLILANAGDFILWDSRTIHGGYVGSGTQSSEAELARLAFAICMVPAKQCKPKTREFRWKAFAKGKATTHWPNGMATHATNDTGGENITHDAASHVPLELTEEQAKLIGILKGKSKECIDHLLKEKRSKKKETKESAK